MAEKIMPHSIDAEKAVLCSMFLTKYALQLSVEGLEEELFYFDKNAKIFHVIKDLYEKGSAIDVTTVTAALEKEKWINSVGGIEYITEIITTTATAANVQEYIKIVYEKAVLRKLIDEGTRIVTDAYSSSNNIDDVLDGAEQRILNVVKNRRGSEFKKIQQVIEKVHRDLEQLSKTKGEITGLATGYSDLDRITTGLHPNELIIIAARPGVGKTAFALNVAMNAARKGDKTVAFFTLEMSAEQLLMRMFATEGKLDLTKLKRGNLENQDWRKVEEAMIKLGDMNVFIDDTAGISVGEIRAKCRKLASSPNGLDLVVIDYLTIIQGSSKYAGNRQQEVSEISRSLKTMALELGVPVIALAQLSRNVEGRKDQRPILSDLRESGAIEQDADIVSFLYREDYGKYEETPDSDVELIIAKHRNGPTGTIDLLFQKNICKFTSVQKKEKGDK